MEMEIARASTDTQRWLYKDITKYIERLFAEI